MTIKCICPKCLKELEINFCKKCGSKATEIIDRGDYLEISPAIGNLHMIAKEVSTMKLSWHEARTYAENLSIGGFFGWRLPTIRELKIIYSIRNICKIEDNADFFWSNYAPLGNLKDRYGVEFETGNIVYSNNIVLGKGYVRCVR